MFSLWIRETLRRWRRMGTKDTYEGCELIEAKYSPKYETVILPKGVLPHPGYSKL